MNKTNLFSTQSLTDLQDFMFDTMLPADDCVDWFCDRHDVNATDDVIDFVVDAHFAFHGEWQQTSNLFIFSDYVSTQTSKRQHHHARRIAPWTCYQTDAKWRALDERTSGRIGDQFSTTFWWYVWRLINTNCCGSQVLLLLRIAAAHQSTPNDQVRLSINVWNGIGWYSEKRDSVPSYLYEQNTKPLRSADPR